VYNPGIESTVLTLRREVEMRSNTRCRSGWEWTCHVLLLAAVAVLVVPPAAAFPGPSLAPGVGIKVTVTDVRRDSLEADMDLTWYTRVGPYPSTVAGYPYIGYPALDYGDGSTLSYTTLALVSSGGGPGGSHVYRNLASFTHTYPALNDYTVTGASFCTACGRYAISVFPTASPDSPVSATSISYVPQTVVGNLAARTTYQTTVPFGDGYSLRIFYDAYLAVTNTAEVAFLTVLDVPTASTWGLAALGALLLLSGLVLLRRL